MHSKMAGLLTEDSVSFVASITRALKSDRGGEKEGDPDLTADNQASESVICDVKVARP